MVWRIKHPVPSDGLNQIGIINLLFPSRCRDFDLRTVLTEKETSRGSWASAAQLSNNKANAGTQHINIYAPA